MEGAITGEVENGSRAQLEAGTLYSGEVGVRDRDGVLELAWFGKPPTFAAAIDATLDGAPIRITSVRHREASANVPIRQRANAPRAIVAAAEYCSLPA